MLLQYLLAYLLITGKGYFLEKILELWEDVFQGKFGY